MEPFVELLKEVNIVQILILLGGFWFMHERLEKKMDKRFDKLEEKVGRLENDMIEIKTVLRLKECCLINDQRQGKKVE